MLFDLQESKLEIKNDKKKFIQTPNIQTSIELKQAVHKRRKLQRTLGNIFTKMMMKICIKMFQVQVK